MIDVIEEVDNLIDVFNDSDFVIKMRELKKQIVNENIVIDRENAVIKEYIKNQNLFDFHIYYLNNEINKLINNKVCGSINESN